MKSLGEKVIVKKLTFSLDMIHNKSTGHESTILASLFPFWAFFGDFGSGPKSAYFFEIIFNNKYFCTVKKKNLSWYGNYICILRVTNINIFSKFLNNF